MALNWRRMSIAVIDQFSSYLGKNGIISEAPNYMFMDWVTVHDDKNPKIYFACHHPPAVIGQGIYDGAILPRIGRCHSCLQAHQ